MHSGDFGWLGTMSVRSLLLLFLQADAQGLEEVEVVVRKRTFGGFAGGELERRRRFGFRFNFVEPDGRFQHQEYIETLLADILDDTGDVLRLRDGLVNCFT